MTARAARGLSLQEFLAWEAGQEQRYEFDGVQAVAMTGGSASHAAIQRNLAIAVGGRLGDGPCQFFGSDLKIQVDGRVRYPDGFVVCRPLGPRDFLVPDPVVVFEILSDGTAHTDLGAKNREYAATPSIRRYVILFQHEVGGTMFERAGDDWIGHILGAQATLAMPEIGIALPLSDLYRGVNYGADGAA